MPEPHHARHLAEAPTETAPDGGTVHPLVSTGRGSLAHFEFAAGQTSTAVRHHTVEEIWYFLSGTGEMWLAGDSDTFLPVQRGLSVTIPAGTGFQIRAGAEAVHVVGFTMPPWPGDHEAQIIEGPWTPGYRADN